MRSIRTWWRRLMGCLHPNYEPGEVLVHVVEWPSGREQGYYFVPTDRDSAIYAYPHGVDYYIDAARDLSICNQPPISQRAHDIGSHHGSGSGK